MLNNQYPTTTQHSSTSEDSDSDDIPLGQRHPDAFKAQTIIREERRVKKTTTHSKDLARAVTIAKLSMKSSQLPDEDDNQPLGLIKRMKSIARPSSKQQQHPTQQPSSIFSVEQLIKKLENVQQHSLKPTVLTTTTTHQIPHPQLDSHPQSTKQLSPPSITQHPHSYQLQTEHPSNHTSHQASTLDTQEITHPHQIKPSPTHKRGHTDHHQQQQQQTTTTTTTTTVKRAQSTLDKTTKSSHNLPPLSTNNPSHNLPLKLPPLSSRANTHHQLHSPQTQHEPRSPAVSKPTIQPIVTKLDHTSSQLHSPIDHSPSLRKKILIKVGIVHRSRSIMVEVDQDTCVKDLLREAEQTGELSDQTSKGSWGVFEVWNDLGIERPIREIETIMSVVNTWTSADTNETHLLIQKNDLSGLSVSKRSFTSGCHGGNLWCELKPGKWTKKYVLLRDNEIYLCSNDKGKDEMFLCTLDKFDVYAIPQWAHKNLKGVPRDYSFGLKSLNKLSFFETKSDFIHKFSCKNQMTQLEWIRRLYDARTYIVMSHRGGGDEPTSVALSRKKSTHSSSRNASLVDKVNGLGLKRNATTAGRHHNKEPMVEINHRKGSWTPSVGAGSTGSGASGLSRRPTLVQASSGSKFKQGTLLGDLAPPAGPPKPCTEEFPTTLQAVLPAHIMALSTPIGESRVVGREPGASAGPGRSSSQPAGTKISSPTIPSTTTTTTIKLRTWEQMGPEERKLYLAEP
ncbi:hypothetical protein VP01_1213g6 [Puccinia sorghi]|uniref:PH domain-containing protein n=1 Tax=Puccinia sorghi TaxID=27349 RepID=A0A0L6VQA3_9BASI|nr:hypothetical protein VP01_1213g6 [Puccinia sorghi]